MRNTIRQAFRVNESKSRITLTILPCTILPHSPPSTAIIKSSVSRVNQRFLVATTTKIDVSGVKVPDNINDKYFARYVTY